MHSVYAIENPLMDYVIHADYAFLERFGAKPGTMQLVDHSVWKSIVDAAESVTVVPGGSGSNTARALAMLLGPEAERLGHPAYSGGIGRDEAGVRFERVLDGLGIAVSLSYKDLPTGVSAIVVTPDHERTMFTHLGACRDFSVTDLDREFLRDSRYLYSTGYMWDTDPQMEALFSAVDEAVRIGIPFCFDLADPFVVDRYWRELKAWIPGRVDVLFGNRVELSRLTGIREGDRAMVESCLRICGTVAMKVGGDGCLVGTKEGIVRVPGEKVACVDTTGAGDSFAAGFLYGLLSGASPETCGRLGNRIASRIVGIEGCRYDLIVRDDILSVL